MAKVLEVIWGGWKQGNFCNQDWTKQITLKWFSKLDFARNAVLLFSFNQS